jgi:F0F1-type ATP synthase membrane subunit b/b'
MAADAYLSTAVSQLRNAISELHDEIRRTQLDAYDHEQLVKAELSRVEYNRANAKVEAEGRGLEGDDIGKQEAQNRLKQLDVSIQQKQQDVSSRSQSAADAVSTKTDLMNKLQSIVSQLEPLIAQARQ